MKHENMSNPGRIAAGTAILEIAPRRCEYKLVAGWRSCRTPDCPQPDDGGGECSSNSFGTTERASVIKGDVAAPHVGRRSV